MSIFVCKECYHDKVGGQAVLGRQDASPTPWLTERHGYDPTSARFEFQAFSWGSGTQACEEVRFQRSCDREYFRLQGMLP